MAIRQQNEYASALNEGPFLVVGLGNKGEKYEHTRHNAGFLAIDHFARSHELGVFSDKNELSATVIETNIAGEKVILAKPATFMNRSGLAVVRLQNYFAVNDPRILIVYDDVDVDFGSIRMRVGGSSGGHNGIKSIEQVIGDQFARIRFGVRNEHLEQVETADFVLSPFSRAETNQLDQLFDMATDQMMAFVEQRFQQDTISI